MQLVEGVLSQSDPGGFRVVPIEVACMFFGRPETHHCTSLAFACNIVFIMANIAFIQHRLGRTDGVSLEVDKWRAVLEAQGHVVHYIAGNDDVPGGHSIPELYPFHPVTARIIRNATRALSDYSDGASLVAEVEAHAALIKPQIEHYLDELDIDVLIPNNLLSVGYNLPGMLALSKVIAERRIPTICHSHDFWWEDSGEVFPTCNEVIELYQEHAPPSYPWIQHVTINRIGQAALLEQRGIESTVVPNVFDFATPRWTVDEYNADFRSFTGVKDNDLLFLQATRILDRKAVELAIDLIATLSTPEWRSRLEGDLWDGRTFGPRDRIVLVCSGYVEGIGLSDSYPAALQRHADKLGVEIVWAGERVKHSRGVSEDGAKIYSLWDSYVQADFVTYPSVWEGWGNQFVEAVYVRLPVVLFEYPVWRSDLAPTGFKVASLGDEISGHTHDGLVQVSPDVLAGAAQEVVHLLKDGGYREEVVAHNAAVAEEHFSYASLSRYIRPLIERAISEGVRG